MKLVCISDTHNQHNLLSIPDGDVLIHAGDATNLGTFQEINKFNQWLGTLPHKHKLYAAGNHDRLFESDYHTAKSLITNAIYLQDDEIVIDGIKFYGSPHTPWFHNWAFNIQRGEDIRVKWDRIPDDTDVLITHGPPYGILDKEGDEHLGCEELLTRVNQLAKLKAHVFGHIHGGAGAFDHNGIVMVNASQLNRNHQPHGAVIEIEI